MNILSIARRWLRPLAAATAAFACLTAPLKGQSVTSSAVSGAVVAPDGSRIAGAAVTAIHNPTGTRYTAISRGDGRYDLRGLIVGGPYTITAEAENQPPARKPAVFTSLADIIEVNLTLGDSGEDIQVLDVLEVRAETNDLDGAALGAGTTLDAARLSAKPTTERSLADLITASPLVTLRSFFGDREEAQITAVGQNNRYNSIQIDGARINDQFGLNGTGLASFYNPLSLETVEQLAVQLSPYDIRQAGFTGASINAVTKSGTNEFHGSVYYYFQGDSWLGLDLRGENASEKEFTGRDIVPALERQTWGATLGGPILPNRLFFFASYEKFESESAGRDLRLVPGSGIEQQILTRLDQYSSEINWGDPVTGATSNLSEDEKWLAKLDWNISDDHRASVRYSKTEGAVPQFGRHASGSLNNYLGLSGGPTASPDGHFYSQTRVEESYTGQVLSDWTPSFKTEVRYARTTQDQLTPVNSVAPEIAIYGITGTDAANGSNVTNGVYVVGTEQFRQGNVIQVETDQFYAAGDYLFENFVFTGGFQREYNDFYNLFRQGSYGRVAFRSLADFLADRPARIERNVFDPSLRPIADLSEFATNGLFFQTKWDFSSALTFTFGLRYEWNEQPVAPAFNQAFFNATGFRNDGTLDGADYISPRVGFNWSLDEERSLQLRGGIGHFTGRTPWVFFSNSYNNLGVGSFTQIDVPASGSTTLPAGTLQNYFDNRFDPANPTGTATDNQTGRREINWADEGMKLPNVWRANLALDKKLSFLDSTASVELVYTKNYDNIFITNENLRPVTSPAADGRQRFAGNPFTQANARFSGYTDLYRIQNADGGRSIYASIVWDRPMKDGWGFNLSYTRGSSKEVQATGQTTASGQWQRNVVFNQNQVEVGTSDFEIRDRFQASVSYRLEANDRWPTTVSLYYEGRTGNPYSFVYNTDLNGDGRSDNDLVAVPSGTDDARFDFSLLSAAQVETYFGYMESTGLAEYAGGVAPKNKFTEPFVNRLDLKFVQEIPIYAPAKLELFFDFINFGAFLSRDIFGEYNIAPLISNDVFRRRFVGGASYGPDGRIRPTVAAPSNFNIDNGQSRWRVQLGARLTF